MRRCIGALMAVLLLTVVEGAAAQRGPAQRGGGARRTQMERMIRARFDGMVREQLDLSEEQEQAFRQVTESYRQRRQEFAREERRVRASLMRLGASALEGEELTEEQANEVLNGMMGLRDEESQLFRQELEALGDVLTPQKLLRFVVMREQLSERSRRIRSGQGRGGRPGGGRPGGGPGWGGGLGGVPPER